MENNEDSGVGATPYPCMPSLVTLQQMRNRIHLAFTGKKLMKWTALALRREMMKIAKELYESYMTFGFDVKKCYILLARARYSNTYLENMVLANVARHANIKTVLEKRKISGVTTMEMFIVDDEGDNYAYMGIGRGGENVAAAKKAWRKLVKKVLFMCHQRFTFLTLEVAYKNAQRKKQLISKIVIPRLKATIRYIKSELEEKEREDTFRLKRFKQLKYKGKKDIGVCERCSCKMSKPKNHKCPVCNAPPKSETSDVEVVDHLVSKKKSPIKVIIKDPLCEAHGAKPASKSVCEEGVCPKITNSDTSTKSVCKPSGQPGIKTCKEDVCPKPITPKNSTKSESKPCSQQSNKKPIFENEFGTFENKFKEIVKVTRHQNPDGTITEEKHVITIRTEKRIPKKDISDNRSNEKCFKSSGHDCEHIEPRETKSEQYSSKDQIEQPTVRSCVSSNRVIANRHRTPCSGSDNDLSIKSTPSRSSTGLKNCSTMTGRCRDRNRTPGSSVTSLSSRKGIKKANKTESCSCGNKTCGKDSKTSCCDGKSRTVATNAALRDAATNTCNIGKKSSNQKKTSFQIGACTSCPSFSIQPRLEKLSFSSKSCSNDVKNEVGIHKKLELNSRLTEKLKNIFLTPPPASFIKVKKIPDSTESTEIQEGSIKSNECQTVKSDEELEITQCDSCGSVTIKSCKSTNMSAGSKSKDSCKTKSIISFKSDTDDDEDIRRDMAKTAKSFNSVCRLKQKRSSTCPACPRDICASCSSQNVKYSDSSTNTRRSARYDVRGVASTPIRLQAKRKSALELKHCLCRSDNTFMKDKDKVRPIRPPSFLPDV